MYTDPFAHRYIQYIRDRGNYLRKPQPFQPGNGGEMVNFAANDYLELAAEPQLAAVLAKTKELGSGSSRLLSGLRQQTLKLEADFAAFTDYADALLFPSGFQANLTILEALLEPRVLLPPPITVYADIYDHASINIGLRLARGIRRRHFRHNDLGHLESLLERDRSPSKVIITETLFSMDGDCPQLGQLEKLAQKHQAFLYLDDAHAFAALGDNGRGLAAGRGALAVIGLGKGSGLWGAMAVFKDKTLKEYLVNRCAGIAYSTAPSPILVALAAKMLELLPQLAHRRQKLRDLGKLLRDKLNGLDKLKGIKVVGEAHIISLILGDNDAALALSQSLAERGFYAPAIRPPTVARNTARLRLSLSAGHSREQVAGLGEAISGLLL